MFNKKTWTDRISEYPTRRILTDESGKETVVSVARDEGVVREEGDFFDADTMNDLEGRIGDEFDAVNGRIPNFVNKDFYAEQMGVLSSYADNPVGFIEWLADNGYFSSAVNYFGKLQVSSNCQYIGMYTSSTASSFVVWSYKKTPISVTKANGVWSAKELGRELTQDILWTNPDKTATFAGQTVSIPNINNYKMFVIDYYNSTASTTPFQRILTFGGVSMHDIWGFSSNSVIERSSRVVSVNNGIVFGDCVHAILNNTGGKTDNNYLIPMRIRGFK